MDKILLGIFLFAVGAIMYSFLNVVINKLSKETKPRCGIYGRCGSS